MISTMVNRVVGHLRRPVSVPLTLFLLGGVTCPLPTAAQIGGPARGDLYTGLVYEYQSPFVVAVGDTNSLGGWPLSERPYPKVVGVHPCSPAHIAGVEPGDVIRGIDGRDGRTIPLFGRDAKVGTTHVLALRRDEEALSVEMKTVRWPDDIPDAVFDSPIGPTTEWDCPSPDGRTPVLRRLQRSR